MKSHTLNTKARAFGLVAASLVIAACGSSSDPAPAVDLPPEMLQIGNASIKANAPSDPIAISVLDERPDLLTFTASSDNQELVPADGIVISGTSGDRQIVITPVTDTLGEAQVTVTVTDAAGFAASRSFLVSVTAVRESLQMFTRSAFAESQTGDPLLINAIEFERDAEGDDFGDLLGP